MKKKLSEILDVSLPIYIIINLLYILVGSYMVFNKIILYSIFSYGYIVLLTINILIILILFFKKKYKKNKIDIFLLLIIIFALISTIFAYKPNKALFGEWGRYEGLFVICYYMTIIFITSFLKKEDRKIIVYSILVFGFIQCIYAICQKLNLFNVYTRIEKGWRWATGFTGNRNFFGTLMLSCICYSIGLYIKSKGKIETICLLTLTYIFSVGLLLSKTRSAMIGLVIVMMILFIYAIKKKYLKKYITLFLVLVFSTALMQLLNLTPVIKYVNTAKTEISNTIKGNVDDGYGSGRIEIWKKTIQIVPRYIVHGIGVDNFANIIDGKPIIRENTIVDKAHNEYLQILVTTGIFSLISYLCMHFIAIKEGIKNKEIYYILPIIGYLVQAQFNISIIEVAPIFYIGIGLLINRD